MLTSSIATMPRADLRSLLEAQDDPKSREAIRVYPGHYGPPMVHHYSEASAADVMDRFEGSTGGEIQRNASLHLDATAVQARRNLKLGAGLGIAALASGVALGARLLPGPLGVVMTAASALGMTFALHRFDELDGLAKDDQRLLAAMDKAGAGTPQAAA